MPQRLFPIGLLVLIGLVTALSGGNSAQAAPPYELGFSGNTPRSPSRSLGEYKISLDNRFLENALEIEEESDAFASSRFRPTIPEAQPRFFPVLSRDRTPDALSLPKEDLRVPPLPGFQAGELGTTPRSAEQFGGTLTLSADQLNEGRFGSARRSRVFSGGKRIGRWAVYGEFNREDISRMPVSKSPSSPGGPQAPSLSGNLAASVKPATGNEVTKTMEIQTVSEKIESLALDNYYLEAIYNFRPSLQGKVSYKKSVIETVDQNEKLQVEGIVEAGKDVLIKAGYRNQTAPEVKDRKPSKDTQVWTEFILKF